MRRINWADESNSEMFFDRTIFYYFFVEAALVSLLGLVKLNCLHVFHVGLLSIEQFLIPLPHSTIFLQFLNSIFQYCCMTIFLMWYCFTLPIFASYIDKVPYFYYLLKTYKQIFKFTPQQPSIYEGPFNVYFYLIFTLFLLFFPFVT